MKKSFSLITASLLCCLFIYVFYRTDKTVINQFLILLFSKENFLALKAQVQLNFPLHGFIIYSLPEGLWVFCITLTSGPYVIQLGKKRFGLLHLPLVIAFMLEVFQLLHITNGRFDPMDILFAMAGWLCAMCLVGRRVSTMQVGKGLDLQTVSCFLCYAIVYLSHVNY